MDVQGILGRIFDPQNPQQAAILQTAFSLLGQQGLGQSGLAGINAAMQYKQRQQQEEMRKQQQELTGYQLGNARRQQEIQNLPQQFLKPGGETVDATGGLDTPAQKFAPSFDQTGYINALMGKDPLQALQYEQAIKKTTPAPVKLGQGEKLLDPNTYLQLAENPKAPDQTPLAKLLAEKASLPPGSPLVPIYDAQIAKLTTHPPATNIKIDNKLGEGLAKEVGPMVSSSFAAAQGAQQQIATSDSIIKAIDSGKVLTGPGATFRLRGAQIGQALGVGGGDSQQVIANTRTLIQGLAQSTVAARSALKGQGQVSDFEGRLLEKAASGNIDDMTAGEIKQVVAVNKRLAQKQLENHQNLVGKLKTRESTAGLADLFDVPNQPQSLDWGALPSGR